MDFTIAKLADLHPAPWNPRLIKDERFEKLCKSLEADPDFLKLRPILATKDGTIYAGNMRFRAAQHLGWGEIPAIITDIDEKTAKERAVRDNGSFGEWQFDELTTLLDELDKAGTDIENLGVDVPEVDAPDGKKKEVSFMAEKEGKQVSCPECGHSFTP